MTYYAIPRPSIKAIKEICEEQGWPIETHEAITIINLWDNMNPKPHNLTLWIIELIETQEDN